MADAEHPAEPAPESKEQVLNKETEEEDPREALKREWREAVRKTRPKDAAGMSLQVLLSPCSLHVRVLLCSTVQLPLAGIHTCVRVRCGILSRRQADLCYLMQVVSKVALQQLLLASQVGLWAWWQRPLLVQSRKEQLALQKALLLVSSNSSSSSVQQSCWYELYAACAVGSSGFALAGAAGSFWCMHV
jgi:hypothetical protein